MNPVTVAGPPVKNYYDDSFYRFSQYQAALISRYMKRNTRVWYCPSNQFNPPAGQPQISEDDFYPPDHNLPWVGSPIRSGRSRYWWLGNPNPPDYNGPLVDVTGQGDFFASATPGTMPPPQYKAPAYRDVNKNGTIRDEYMRKLGDKNVAEIVVSTDWSGQIGGTNRGWFFLHGKQAWMSPSAPVADKKKLYRSWKNNLYGDGHAESKRPDEVQWRWGPNGPACW